MPCQALTTTEKRTLKRLEKIIASNIRATAKVGKALLHIRDNRLYREHFPTFGDYLQQRWDFCRATGYNKILQVEAGKALSNVLDKNSPISVRKARALASVPPEVQRQIHCQAENPDDPEELKRLAEQWTDGEVAKIQEEEKQALESARAVRPAPRGKDIVKRIEELWRRLDKLFGRVDFAESAEDLVPVILSMEERVKGARKAGVGVKAA